jgi:hypothetical protein
MKNFLKHLFFSLGVAFTLTQMQVFFESRYITAFLKQNLVTILVALLAINCTTLGIVLTKLRELIDSSKKGGAFSGTKKEMMRSINEQIVLIVTALVLLLIQDSKWLESHVCFTGLIQVLVMACFVFAIMILYDTAKSVFVILDYEGNTKE